jgi:protein TonB
MEAPVEKKSPSKIVVIGLGIAALAAIGFFLLRASKRPAPVDPAPQETSGTMTTSETPSQPVQEAAPPVVKTAPAKSKPQPQVKPTEQAGAQAILPAQTASLALPPPGSAPGGEANGRPDGPKTEEPAAPDVKTGTESSPTSTSGTTAASETAPAAAPAPVQVNEGDLVELAAVTEAPRLSKKVDPIYPPAAQRAGRGGAITVNALIDEKGNVVDTAILKGIQDDKGLARAAETAIRKWKFQPARKNGVAVKVWKPFVITFKADANPANEV